MVMIGQDTKPGVLKRVELWLDGWHCKTEVLRVTANRARREGSCSPKTGFEFMISGSSRVFSW